MRRRTMGRVMVAAACLGWAVTPVLGQDLADYDYENLSFRGVGLDWGYMVPTRVESTQGMGLRVDLGYLGPGLRIVPGVSYWSSPLKAGEVAELEDRVAELVETQVPGAAPAVDLGTIDWSAVALSLDAHVVWSIPYDVLTYAGLGVAAHLMNGDGSSINGTFVEDLLDSVTAGVNVHAGVEYPLVDRFRVYGESRYEVLGDLRYFRVRIGGQFMVGDSAPGEERQR